MTLLRPVYQRASLIAFSFDSAPPFVKNDIFRLPGVTSASRRPSSERGSVAIGGATGDTLWARSLFPATSLRCWWPVATCPAHGGGTTPCPPSCTPSPSCGLVSIVAIAVSLLPASLRGDRVAGL